MTDQGQTVMAAVISEAQQQKEKPPFNKTEVAAKILKELGTDAQASLKLLIAEEGGVNVANISDSDVFDVVCEMHSAGTLDDTLRAFGLVPKPGFFSAISGWHDIEHLRSEGFTNTVAGLVGLATKGAVYAYAAWQAWEYFTRD